MFPSKRIIYHFDSCQCLYVSLSGWSTKELNFNKEFQEFVTVFMFLVDSQWQGLCRISSHITTQLSQIVPTRVIETGALNR